MAAPLSLPTARTFFHEIKPIGDPWPKAENQYRPPFKRRQALTRKTLSGAGPTSPLRRPAVQTCRRTLNRTPRKRGREPFRQWRRWAFCRRPIGRRWKSMQRRIRRSKNASSRSRPKAVNGYVDIDVARTRQGREDGDECRQHKNGTDGEWPLESTSALDQLGNASEVAEHYYRNTYVPDDSASIDARKFINLDGKLASGYRFATGTTPVNANLLPLTRRKLCPKVRARPPKDALRRRRTHVRATGIARGIEEPKAYSNGENYGHSPRLHLYGPKESIASGSANGWRGGHRPSDASHTKTRFSLPNSQGSSC